MEMRQLGLVLLITYVHEHVVTVFQHTYDVNHY